MLVFGRKRCEGVVALFWPSATVIPDQITEQRLLWRSETTHPSMQNEVLAVFVVARAVDVVANIMEEGCVLKHVSICLVQVQRRCHGVKNAKGQVGDLAGMLFVNRVSIHEA